MLKKIVLILLGLFALSGLAFAGGQNEGAADGSGELKPVKLKMYLLGDKQKDFDMVYEKVNTKLKEDINAELEVVFLSWGDFTNKYPLLFAAGEEFDLIYTSNWAFYAQEATKGGFLELTEEMIKNYAPRTWENTPSSSWEQVKINDKVFMLPYTKREFGHFVYVVRGDLMDKYGLDNIETIDDFEKYLDVIAENETNMIPYDDGSEANRFMLPTIGINYANDLPQQLSNDFILGYNVYDKDGSVELINRVTMPEYLEYAEKMVGWNAKGYWSKNALVNKTRSKDSFANGKSAAAILNLGDANTLYMELIKSHPEWDMRVFDATDGAPSMPNPAIQNGMAINALSKNPERALMLLDLFKNDREYYDLTNYGIEGIHYESVGDEEFIALDAAESFPPVSACPWGWMSPMERRLVGGLPNYDEILNNWEKEAMTHPLQMFNFDDSNVKNEWAACYNIVQNYDSAIQMGFGGADTAELYNEYVDALNKAGIQRIMEEMQKQVNDFLSK
ncbi:MAG: ABC transporter substrate-binding protein [Spirochaetales bacterium]|nr:ABC transporter substrate-binding protein [Spirochaetales bacterium]